MDLPSGSIPMMYARKMKNKYGFDVLFPPTSSVELGDYGRISQSGTLYGSTPSPFVRLGNIRTDFGIQFGIPRLKETKTVENLSSTRLSITSASAAGSGGDALAGAGLRIDITFSKKGSVFYHGSEMRLLEIAELGQLEAALLGLEGWDCGWAVVIEVHENTGVVVLLSDMKGSKVQLSGNAFLTSNNLARADANVKVIQNDSGAAEYISSGMCTPIVKVAKLIKKREKAPKKSVMVDCLRSDDVEGGNIGANVATVNVAATNVTATRLITGGSAMGTTRMDETNRRMSDGQQWKLEVVSLWPGLDEEQDASDNQDEKPLVADGAAEGEDDGAAAAGAPDEKRRFSRGAANGEDRGVPAPPYQLSIPPRFRYATSREPSLATTALSSPSTAGNRKERGEYGSSGTISLGEDSYGGDYRSGLREGYMTFTYEDGRCYKGEWLNDMKHGKGVETFKDGSIRHDGQWFRDEPVLK
jgi:MORN repeat